MRLQDLVSSKPVTEIGLFLAQHSPRWLVYGLVRIAATVIARQKPELYWTVQGNLRQIVGPEVDNGTLHEMTRHVFYHAGQTYYDFFHIVGQSPQAVRDAINVSESMIKHIRSLIDQGRGVLLLGTHMSNFDLGILAIGAHGLPAQALSVTDPGAGFRVLNRLRATYGLEVTPITPESLRAAIRRLKGGGLVLTGVDRPIPEDRELIDFFGRPAYLPVGPTRLALMTGAVVFIGSCHHDADGGYVLQVTGPVGMERTGDRRRDILTNARRIAAIVEGYVRAHPEQWMMFHPFWP